MKSIAAGIILAVLLFAGGALSFQESRHSKRLAEAQQRLATLQYTDEADMASDATFFDRLPPPLGIEPGTESRHMATVSYWLARYTSLTESTNAVNGPQNDSTLLLLAANAAFRTSAPQSKDTKGVISRLDQVVQAYADVLRKDPTLTDAAFNYEYVVKLRDTIAKGPSKNAKAAVKAPSAPDVSVDLPTGPTIHGRPGGPPEGESMSDFKTVTPMRYDEREEQMDPGRGQKLQRKG
ncbi:MAG: hypothetical protein U0Q11_02430 [Vicinamibacterales bacterium]